IQSRERRVGSPEQLTVRIARLGEFREQFRHVVSGIQPRKLPLARAKTPLQLGFGKQVEGIGRFADEDYTDERQQVNSAVKRSLRPPRPLRQSPNLAKILREQRDDAACLAELHHPQNDPPRFLASHAPNTTPSTNDQ